MMEEHEQFFSPDQIDEQVEQHASGPHNAPETQMLREMQQVASQIRVEHAYSLQRTWDRLQEESKKRVSFPPDEMGEKAMQRQESSTQPPAFLREEQINRRRPHNFWRRVGIGIAAAVALINILAWTLLSHTLHSQRTQMGTGGRTTPTHIITNTQTPCIFQDQGTSVLQNYTINHTLSWSPNGELTVTSQIMLTFDMRVCRQVSSPPTDQTNYDYWSPDGTRLLAIGNEATIVDRQGHVLVKHDPSFSPVVPGQTSTPSPNVGSYSRLGDSAWSPDGMRIASVYAPSEGAITNHVEIWSAETGAPDLMLFCPNSVAYGVHDVTWSPNGQYVAATVPTAKEGIICVWNARTGKIVSYLGGSNSNVTFSADSRELAFARANTILIYEVAPEKLIRRMPTQEVKETITHIAWSPNGKSLAVGGRDLSILDAATGKVLATYAQKEPLATIEQLAWSPDSTMVATLSTKRSDHTAFVSAWHA